MIYLKVVVGTLFVVAIAVFFALFAVQIAYGQEDQRNQVSDWCDDGMKFDNLDGASFTVPDPPEGTTWTLLVIKAGQVNTEVLNPIPGQAYFPSNEQDVSHTILCYEEGGTPSTTTSTSTSTSTSTTSTSTTTTAPTTSTSSSVPPSTTSTRPPDSSSTTVPPSVSTTAPPVTDTTETPVGGVPAGGGAMAQHLVTDDPVNSGPSLWLIVGGAALAAALSALGVLAWRAR